MKKSYLLFLALCCAISTYAVELPGFAQNEMMHEQTRDIFWGGDVNIHINAPGADSLKVEKETIIIFFACPAGNSIEWTIGKQMEAGDDWHYDIQHIGAQTRFLRNTLKDKNIVVVYLQNSVKSWSAYDDNHPNDYVQLIQSMADDVLSQFSQFDYKVALNGHSAGGSWVLRYLLGVSEIPQMITRIGFLDSNYNYKYDADHYDGLFRQFLNERDSTYICVIAYNDSVALYNGSSIVSAQGGTWWNTRYMKRRLDPYFTFIDSVDVDFQRHSAKQKRFQILLKENPTQAILHTVQVYRNGFIHSMLSGTEYENAGYTYYSDPVYTEYIQGNPPLEPTGAVLLPEGGNSVNFKIRPVSDAAGYRLYLSNGEESNTDTIFSESGSGSFTVPQGELTLIRISAVNCWGESELSGLYPVLCNSDTNRILIANAYTKELRHDYLLPHASAVQSSGVGGCSIASCDMSEILSGELNMLDFPMVDLLVGKEDRRSETLGDEEQDLVKTYLQNGGNLFISGMELGYDLYVKGTETDTVFYRDYLKAVCVDDKPFGESSAYYDFWLGCFNFDDTILLLHSDDGSHGRYKNSDPDELLGLDGTYNFLNLKKDDGTTCCVGVAYSGIFPGGTVPGKLLYSSIPFETVYDPYEAEDFMYRVLCYFSDCGVDVTPTDIPKEFSLSTYPNPFNPSLTISYDLPVGSDVSCDIFNISGDLIISYKMKQSSGQHDLQWDGSKQPSGIYFIRFNALSVDGNNWNYSKYHKVTLLK